MQRRGLDLFCFFLYSAVYLGFMALAAFRQDLMATTVFGGINLAVAYGMGRDTVDRGRPDVIPQGATETGVIDIAVPAARRVELVLSLFPAGADPSADRGNAPAARTGTTAAPPVPVVLEATFSGLDRLPVTAAP